MSADAASKRPLARANEVNGVEAFPLQKAALLARRKLELFHSRSDGLAERVSAKTLVVLHFGFLQLSCGPGAAFFTLEVLSRLASRLAVRGPLQPFCVLTAFVLPDGCHRFQNCHFLIVARS